MPFNLLKNYPALLEIESMTENERRNSLLRIFRRDIEENDSFKFRDKQIRPIKKEGSPAMQTLFHHLITRKMQDDAGKEIGSRVFDVERSKRLHWIKYHVEELKQEKIEVFSYEDRIDSKDVIRTYILDIKENYVIILEPQRSGTDYYLLTAYYLNEAGGKKQIQKKLKNKLGDVH